MEEDAGEAAVPDEQRCRRGDGKLWRCKRPRVDGEPLGYCEVHLLQRRKVDQGRNEKRRKKNKRRRDYVEADEAKAMITSNKKIRIHDTDEEEECGTEVALDRTEKCTSPERAIMDHDMTIKRAMKLQESLDHRFPSFVKSLYPSHVTGRFRLGLPISFCRAHLPKVSVMMNVIDENQKQYKIRYSSSVVELGGGWEDFSNAHNLVAGDVLVFQLVKPTDFQVYIVRAYNLADTDGVIALQSIDALQEQTESCKAGKHTKTGAKTVERHENAPPVTAPEEPTGGNSRSGSEEVVSNGLKGKHTKTIANTVERHEKTPLLTAPEEPTGGNSRSGSEEIVSNGLKGKHTKTSANSVERHGKTLPLTAPAEPTGGNSRSGSQEVVSNGVTCIKVLSTTLDFKDIKNLQSFTIAVNGFVMDSELSEQARSRYYELCCSQKGFLHDNLSKIINCKCAAGIISQTINIADHIRASKLSTSLDDFEEWDKNLRAFELLGMNVGFLRTRIKKLLSLINESEGVNSAKFEVVKARRDGVNKEIRTCRAKLVELKETSNNIHTEIETLEVSSECYKLKLRAVAEAPW